MTQAKSTRAASAAAVLSYLVDDLHDAVDALERLLARARDLVRQRVGGLSAEALETHQREAHGLAWLATYVTALRQLSAYAERQQLEGRLGETEALLAQIAASEYLAQILGGIPMSQGEMVRLRDLGLAEEGRRLEESEAVRQLLAGGSTAASRLRLIERMTDVAPAATYGDPGLDATLEEFRGQIRRFCADEVEPNAHAWHLGNSYIPLDVIGKLGELGVFGLTIPEAYGGLGLGKVSMCVVSEELSRGYIGVGSLGTRSEIAAELILGGGTEEQRRHWLPRIASGEVLPTAVFTEPDTGSDLASLKTRAVREGDGWRITGQKTWITHPVRADLMTVLARSNPQERGYRGLSMFLAAKPRGSDADPFPVEGLTGSEIEVLGYRGMKEFDLSFDRFHVAGEGLLGGEEGQGFKQLMQTFESARIQTAARAVGVAQSALDLALKYAGERKQFGKPIVAFPRVSDKIVMMAAEVMLARQLTYYAAREKDAGRRCDLEAGMAKLLAARVAWAAADNALQIHGGNGFALEFPISRVLCDARILNIFEGAAEIQAQVIARRLLEERN